MNPMLMATAMPNFSRLIIWRFHTRGHGRMARMMSNAAEYARPG